MPCFREIPETTDKTRSIYSLLQLHDVACICCRVLPCVFQGLVTWLWEEVAPVYKYCLYRVVLQQKRCSNPPAHIMICSEVVRAGVQSSFASVDDPQYRFVSPLLREFPDFEVGIEAARKG